MKELQKYLDLSNMMVLATTDLDGEPYTSNVYFSYDDTCIYFISRPTREHSQHIQNNNSIAWSVINTNKYSPSDNDKKGLQFQGICSELGDIEGQEIYESVYNKRIQFGSMPEEHKVYRCIPKKVKIWDESVFGGNGKVIIF